MTFPEILSDLLRAPGALGAAFLDPQGQTIAQAGESESIEVIAAYQSVWLGEMGRIAERAGLGELADLSLDFESRRILAAEVKHGYFILVVFDATGVSSIARSRLGAARESLAAEIG